VKADQRARKTTTLTTADQDLLYERIVMQIVMVIITMILLSQNLLPMLLKQIDLVELQKNRVVL